MLYTLDGGVNWNIRQNPGEPDNIVSIYFSDINNGWAVARNKIINTTTGGIDPNSWNIKTSVTDYIFEDIYFADQSKGWAIDIHDPNKINSLFTNNGGNNWSVNSSSPSSGVTISGVGITDISTAWILGDSGKLFKTSDGGISWTMINTNTSETLKGIYFINSTEGWIAGANGTILHTANGGNDWTVIKSPTTASLDIPYFIDSTKGWIVGTGGTILKYLQ